MSTFSDVEDVWVSRLGNLRNTVRQHLIREQLGAHVAQVRTVLDVGCGQGTQALHLASLGKSVTGVDPSADLLRRMRWEAGSRGLPVRTLQGTVQQLSQVLGDERFDLVCAHGLFMYLQDPSRALEGLARHLDEGGLVSFTVRNQDALAFRPGMRGDWRGALDAFGATSYVGELGARAHAHTLGQAREWCTDLGLDILSWYGVRVFTDATDPTVGVDPKTIADCLSVEEEAGRRDPYRRLASQLHVVARRPQ